MGSRIAQRVLQEGFGRLVVLEHGGAVVRKTFSAAAGDDPEELARAEFQRLGRLHAALDEVPGAVCPRPIELVDEPSPGFRMERLEGEPLLAVLRRRRLPPAEREALAQVMARTLSAHLAAVGEPYHDFQFDNVLYDERSGTLGFVDLGLPQGARPPDFDASPAELTLGNLLGSVVFQSARPRSLLELRRHRGAVELARALVDAFEDDARAEQVTAAAKAAYERCAYGRSAAVTTWYATVGWVVARRVRLPGLSFGPVPIWRVRRRRARGRAARS